MSKEIDPKEVVSITKAELQAMLTQVRDSTSEAVKKEMGTVYSQSMKELAAAILESRKPYKDPGHEATEKAMRESMRQVNERMKAQVLASQATCPHLQGSSENSDFTGQLSSIVMHELDCNLIVGICTNCQKHIFSNDPDTETQKLFRMKSGNRMSRAGHRTFRDPVAAMAAGRLEQPA